MRRRGFSIRSKLLAFAVGLSIVPFVIYLVWAGINHTEEQKAYEEQVQQSYGWMLSNAVNAHFYGFVNEQIESITALKNSLASLGSAVERLSAGGLSRQELEVYLESLCDDKLQAFIFSRISEERSINFTERSRELLRAHDLKGQPLLQHLLRDRLSPEGFYFYLHNSSDHSYAMHTQLSLKSRLLHSF